MPDLATAWAPRGSWDGIASAGHFGAMSESGTTITLRDGLGIGSLIAEDGGKAALARAVEARFGLELPLKPCATRSASHALVWVGPGQWLLIAEAKADLAGDLAALADAAAVADQSDGRAVLRLSGVNARDVLAKGCMLDLHGNAFPVDAAASTSIAYIGVQICRAEDDPDDEAVFELMAPRSMAGSFWSWLSASAAEFGCVVVASGRG